MLPLYLHLHLLWDVRDHQVDQTADEEDQVLRKKHRWSLHQLTAGSKHDASVTPFSCFFIMCSHINLTLTAHEVLTLSRCFLHCSRDTDLKHDDKSESNGEEVEVIWEVFPVLTPVTAIPAQDKKIVNNSRCVSPHLQDSWCHRVVVVLPTCRVRAGVAGCSWLVMLPV